MNGDNGRPPSFRTEPGHPAFHDIPMEKLDDACAWLKAYRGGLRAGSEERGAIFLRGLPARAGDAGARVIDDAYRTVTVREFRRPGDGMSIAG